MKVKAIAYIIASLTLLSGCGGEEIDDTAYVVAIGVDRSEGETYEFTFAIGNPGSINGDGGGDTNVVITETAFSDSIFSAGESVAERTGQRVNFSHAELIVFSDQVAAKGIGKFLDSLTRTLQQRPKLVPVTSNSTAKETLSAIHSEFEGNPEKYLKKIFEKGDSPVSVNIYGREVFGRTKIPDGGVALPCIKTEDENISVNSMSVFYGDKLVGDFDDIYAYKLICGSGGNTYIDTDGGTLCLIQRDKPCFNVTCGGGTDIDIKIVLHSTVVTSLSDKEKLRTDAEKIIEERVTNLLKYSTSDIGIDVFGFYKIARKCFLTEQKWRAYEWAEKYKKAVFNVDVEILPEKTGLIRGDA